MIESVSVTPDGVTSFDDDVVAARGAPGTTWVRVKDGTPEEFERVAGQFDIHPLSIEDVLGDVRPKTEVFDNHTFLLTKTARLAPGETTFTEELTTESVGLFFGQEWLVTMSPAEIGPVGAVWDGLASDVRSRRAGPDYLASRILDRVVDDYFALLDAIETDIEAIETEVLDGPDESLLEAMNATRLDLLSLRKLLWPTRDAVSTLARGDPEHVRVATEKYYRDVYDHLVQLVDLAETYRDLVAGSRDVYLNTLSQSTNEVMKRLTVVATVVLPLTFVVGVFGMNFGETPWNMPELTWPLAYPAVMLGMAVVAGILVGHFRREGWL